MFRRPSQVSSHSQRLKADYRLRHDVTKALSTNLRTQNQEFFSTQMEGPMTSQITATEKSLKFALQSNRQMQVEILRQIQSLAKQKSDNRKLASRVSGQLFSKWEQIDKLRTPVPSTVDIYTEIENAQRTGGQEDEEATTTHTDAGAKSGKRPVQMPKRSNVRRLPKTVIKKWQYDPYRKWTRRFFIDPDGKIPTQNGDVAKRRALEKGKTFHHAYSKWSKKEIEILRCLVSEQLDECTDQYPNECGTNSTASHPEDVTGKSLQNQIEILERVNFDQIACSLEERMNGKGKSPRSSAECRTVYLNSINTSAFSKEESLQLLKLVHSRKDPICWKEVASSLGGNRTPWQCMATYNTTLLPRGQPKCWTPAEDELILKYAAAMGPQWHLDGPAAANLSSRLLPDKSIRQILMRAHGSLVNPNYIHDVWSDAEERTLALCMKIYRDDPDVLLKSSSHLPGRSTKSIAEKWSRSLNPDISQKPFSKEEDKRLLEAVKASESLEFGRISRENFPDRHPRTLRDRWSELATKEDLMKFYGNSRRKKEGARRVVGTSGGSELLSPDDFVVRIKTKSLPSEAR